MALLTTSQTDADGGTEVTGGNLLYYADLTTSKTINSGDAAPSFAAGALTVQEDN